MRFFNISGGFSVDFSVDYANFGTIYSHMSDFHAW